MALARIFLMVGGRAPRVGPGAGVLSGPGRRRSLPQLLSLAPGCSVLQSRKRREVVVVVVGLIGRDRRAERSSRS